MLSAVTMSQVFTDGVFWTIAFLFSTGSLLKDNISVEINQMKLTYTTLLCLRSSSSSSLIENEFVNDNLLSEENQTLPCLNQLKSISSLVTLVSTALPLLIIPPTLLVAATRAFLHGHCCQVDKHSYLGPSLLTASLMSVFSNPSTFSSIA